MHLRGGEPQVLALLDFDGRLLALEQDIEPDAAGASLDDPAARALADRFLSGVGLDPVTLRPAGAVATECPGSIWSK